MEEKIEKKENNALNFLRNNAWLVAALCGLLSIICLLGVVVTVKIKVDGVKSSFDVHLWDYFKGRYKFDWTMSVSVGLIALGIVSSLLHKFIKELDPASTMFFLLGAILLILSREFYQANEIANLKSVERGWGSAVAIALCFVSATLSLTSGVSEKTLTTRDIAEDGILIAMAFVLNLIKLPIATGGGSVNFQMLPLFLIALRHGPTRGLICGGIIYGMLTCVTDGYGLYTYPFDYLVPFGSVMIVGYFKRFILSEKQTNYNIKGLVFIVIACAISTFIRFIGSTASSIIVYGVTFKAGIKYNAIYIPVSGAIATAAVMILYGPLIAINKRYPATKS